MKRKADVAVIGGGPAGLAAALKASEAGAKVIVLERDSEPGGILQQCIHNGFGLHYFGEELTGPEYAGRFLQKVKADPNIEVLCDTMVLSFTQQREILAVSASLGLIEVSQERSCWRWDAVSARAGRSILQAAVLRACTQPDARSASLT